MVHTSCGLQIAIRKLLERVGASCLQKLQKDTLTCIGGLCQARVTLGPEDDPDNPRHCTVEAIARRYMKRYLWGEDLSEVHKKLKNRHRGYVSLGHHLASKFWVEFVPYDNIFIVTFLTLCKNKMSGGTRVLVCTGNTVILNDL